MNDKINLSITEIVSSPYCISAEDGQKVFDEILPLLAVGQKLILSFKGVGTLIPLFLNVAIGQLYGSFTEEQVRALVKVDGLAEDDLEMLKRVVDNAKKYYANAASFDAAWESEGVEDEK